VSDPEGAARFGREAAAEIVVALLAAITDKPTARKILEHLDLPARVVTARAAPRCA
jgi:hypothetical protein